MRFLIDEQLNADSTTALNFLARLSGHELLHMERDLACAGTQDPEIPALCASNAIDVLITMNVRDFGAKKYYFQALLDAGIHVVVLRPGRLRLDVHGQVGLLAPRLPEIYRRVADSVVPVLVVVRPGSTAQRTLEELAEEIEAEGRLP